MVGLVLVLAGGAYLLRQDDARVPDRLAQQQTPQPTCTPAATAPSSTAARPVALPRPQQVRLALFNGTPRGGLAKKVGDELASRGFVVTAQANAPAALAGASQVTFGAGAEPAATVVSRWVLGSQTRSNPRVPAGTVQVILGSTFTRLASPAEVAVASRPAATVPTATPASTSASTPALTTC